MFAITIAQAAASSDNFRSVLDTNGHTQVVAMTL